MSCWWDFFVEDNPPPFMDGILKSGVFFAWKTGRERNCSEKPKAPQRNFESFISGVVSLFFLVRFFLRRRSRAPRSWKQIDMSHASILGSCCWDLCSVQEFTSARDSQFEVSRWSISSILGAFKNVNVLHVSPFVLAFIPSLKLAKHLKHRG